MLKHFLLATVSLSMFVISTAAYKRSSVPYPGSGVQGLPQLSQVTVTLNSGTVIQGILLNINGDSYELRTKHGVVTLSLTETSSLAFDPTIPNNLLSELLAPSES